MRRVHVLVLAAVLTAANFLPTALRAESAAAAETMEAAQALSTQLFAHGFVTLNAQAVEIAWPGIENALRAQKPNIDAATLA